MFVSVVLDPGSLDSSHSLGLILTRFGLKKVQRAVWESITVTSGQIVQLKREIDLVTDYYDKVRIYQYPVGGMFEMSVLSGKKWKKSIIRSEITQR